ncbi:hypothetical protein FRC06_008532, partial [Ceratobasidium sp. 370]
MGAAIFNPERRTPAQIQRDLDCYPLPVTPLGPLIRVLTHNPGMPQHDSGDTGSENSDQPFNDDTNGSTGNVSDAGPDPNDELSQSMNISGTVYSFSNTGGSDLNNQVLGPGFINIGRTYQWAMTQAPVEPGNSRETSNSNEYNNNGITLEDYDADHSDVSEDSTCYASEIEVDAFVKAEPEKHLGDAYKADFVSESSASYKHVNEDAGSRGGSLFGGFIAADRDAPHIYPGPSRIRSRELGHVHR